MGKRIPIPVWTIILFLIGGIGSITLAAWTNDTNHLQKNINDNNERIVLIESKCNEFATIEYVNAQDESHLQESIRLNNERQKQLDLMQNDITIIKNYILK